MSDATLDAAGRLERLAARVPTWEYAAQGAVGGSVTCETAAAEAARHWEFTLGKLAGEVRLFGSDLRQAATDYRATDAGAAARLRQSSTDYRATDAAAETRLRQAGTI